MKGTTILLALALISVIAYSGVIVESQRPVVTLQSTQNVQTVNKVPVVFQFGTITVPKQLWFTGLHGLAYKQVTYLYPAYQTFTVRTCSYTVYGPTRIYSYELWGGSGPSVKVFSSVQNN